MTGSPRQNRVTPYGDLVATPERGLVYGNRGCLHDADGRIRRRYNGKRWIGCRLEFKGWRRKLLMQPGKFTELFFLDEATAFAAGHRPCALCRRAEYEAFRRLWAGGQGALPSADEMDAVLHEERVDPAPAVSDGTRPPSAPCRTAAASSTEAAPTSSSAIRSCPGRRAATARPCLVPPVRRWTCSRRPRSPASCAPAGGRTCRCFIPPPSPRAARRRTRQAYQSSTTRVAGRRGPIDGIARRTRGAGGAVGLVPFSAAARASSACSMSCIASRRSDTQRSSFSSA